MRNGRRGQVLYFRPLIKPAQRHRIARVRQRTESSGFLGRHRPALQRQAAHAVGRQSAEIVLLRPAQITLGRHVQAHGLAHVRSEEPREIGVAQSFMPVVDAIGGRILTQPVHHVADIVQKCGGDQRWRAARVFGEQGRLQCVLKLRDPGQPVAALPLALEHVRQPCGYVFHHDLRPVVHAHHNTGVRRRGKGQRDDGWQSATNASTLAAPERRRSGAMLEQAIDCVVTSATDARPLHAVRPPELARLFERLPQPQAAYLRDLGFAAQAGELHLLADANGVAGAVLGVGDDRSALAFGDLAYRLPAGTTWQLQPGDYDAAAATLGFCLGAYRYTTLKPSERAPARLLAPPDVESSLSQARSIWMGRDLINTPANLLGPVELADVAIALGRRYGAETHLAAGDALVSAYPAVAAVGAGSARPPRVATLHWRGSGAHADSPLVSLCGKGVCFDTGGYDLKPSSAMLRMKKDMGGAACVLALARMIMEADLPLRLAVRVGCVENSVSGTAMRPLDVIRTRAGLTVEVGNTDAEGRLVLCDLLAEAAEEHPAVLIDCATLTGAARTALGPDLPALFCNDETWAASVLDAGEACYDPLWRLPLWRGYDSWLNSSVANINNVSSKPFAGSIVAALFLHRFIPAGTAWIHVDLYAWNDQSQSGRPEGGEVQAARCMLRAIVQRMAGPD
jgi:leucyl aminopeptidase